MGFAAIAHAQVCACTQRQAAIRRLEQGLDEQRTWRVG
jgi:hypothetical protein